MKVHLGILTAAYVHPNFAMSLGWLMRASRCDLSGRDIMGDSCALNRNVVVADAQLSKADYLLFLDSDMEFPAETLNRLMAEAMVGAKDILGCNYLSRYPPHRCLAQPFLGTTEFEPYTQVARLPTGCMLINMVVFDALKRPYFRYSFKEEDEAQGVEASLLSEDYLFCDMAREAGFGIWMDTELSMQVTHHGMMGVRWCSDGIELRSSTGGVYGNYNDKPVLRTGKPVETSAAA